MAELCTKFGTGKEDWETPDSVFVPLDSEFHFSLDVCASSENTKAPTYITKDQNALSQQWNGVCWMNPPFNNVGEWVRKAWSASQDGATVVCLLPARTNTNWWHDYVMKGEVRFLRGRPCFKGAKHGLPQPLAIVIFKP